MKLESPVFTDGTTIPALYTRDGDNISPPLHWQDKPAGTKCFALTLEDQDASSGIVTHWLLYNLPSIMEALDREVPEGGRYGSQALQGMNDFGTIGYCGPVSSTNKRHYILTLYALNSLINLKEGATKDAFTTAIEGHVLAQAELAFVYSKANSLDIIKELREARAHEDAYDLSVHRDEQQPEDGFYDQSDEKRQRVSS